MRKMGHNCRMHEFHEDRSFLSANDIQSQSLALRLISVLVTRSWGNPAVMISFLFRIGYFFSPLSPSVCEHVICRGVDLSSESSVPRIVAVMCREKKKRDGMDQMVLQEEQQNLCSNSSGGGPGVVMVVRGEKNRSCKKAKHSKVPQRGLGIDELEKIIHDRKSATVAAVASLPRNYPPELIIQSSDPRKPSVPLSVASAQIPPSTPSIPITSCSNRPYPRSLNRTILPNASLSHSSARANLQMEPPSNQSTVSSNYNSLSLEEEDKMVTRRGQWLVPSDSPALCKPDDLPPFCRPETLKIDHRNTNTTEGTLGSGEFPVVCRSSYYLRPGKKNGSFLTLGRSALTISSNSRPSQSIVSRPTNCLNFPDLSTQPPYYGSMDEETSYLVGSEQTAFYDFLGTGQQNHQMASKMQGLQTADHIDLNLKL